MSDHGRFIWYELLTPDLAGSKRFYGDLLGWVAQDLPTPDGAEPYSIQTLDGGAGVAGMMNLGAPMVAEGIPPNWTGYICVDDCDASAAKAEALGGSVMRPPMDIPGIGRFAIVKDLGGAVFAIMKPIPPENPPPQPPRDALGRTSWHELYSAAPADGFGFYEALFGWTKDEALEMGPMGAYQLFSNQDGQIGGMMKKPEQVPAPYWNFYFRVGGIDAATEKAKASGAQVLMGPMVVPSGDWVFQGVDPQGALFAVQGFKEG